MPVFLLRLFAALRAWWPWLRWVLLASVVIFAVLTFTQAADYIGARVAQHHGLKGVNTTLQQHDTHKAADLRQQRAADSIRFTLAGRQLEADSAAARLQRTYDAQLSRLPAAPELPRHPPRYRPGGR